MSRVLELKAVLDEARVQYSRIRSLVLSISAETKSGNFKKEELCDIGFLSRELVTQCEEIRKDIGAMKSLVDRVACIKIMQETLTDPTKAQIIQGKYASGKPLYRKLVALPKKDTEEFLDMMDHFGVTDDGLDKGVAKVSWKGVCKYVTELTELGKQIPKFLPKVYDEYTITHRRK